MRLFTRLDHIIAHVDIGLRALCVPKHRPHSRANPGDLYAEAHLNAREKQHVAGLMRVNHAGEICAQALYQGQAITARSNLTREHMQQAASEEIDHLAWCEKRLQDLESSPSHLNFLWYLGSLSLGITAGLLGDNVSLSFLAETELQVSEHIQRHLAALPKQDEKTKAILTQMKEDEMHHAHTALREGGQRLPWPLQQAMRWTSKLLTYGSYYI